MQQFCLNRNDTSLLKTIGIFLIVFSHSLGYPAWYVQGISLNLLDGYTDYIAHFMMYAYVPMFAFLTGYTYNLKQDLSWKYILKKIIGFMLDYYLIFLAILSLACIFCNYKPSLFQIGRELYPIAAKLMMFAWYVPFYCEAMIVLRYLGLSIKQYGVRKSIYICIIIFLILEVLIGFFKSIGLRGEVLVIALQAFKRNIPFVIMGFFFAQEQCFNKMTQLLRKKYKSKNIGFIIVLFFLMIASLFNYKILGLQSGIIYTPIYIFCISSLKIGDNNFIRNITEFLSRHSANIWFLHCIFFSEITRETFQYIVFIPSHNPLIIVCWIILICSLTSIIIMPLQENLKKLGYCQ